MKFHRSREITTSSASSPPHRHIPEINRQHPPTVFFRVLDMFPARSSFCSQWTGSRRHWQWNRKNNDVITQGSCETSAISGLSVFYWRGNRSEWRWDKTGKRMTSSSPRWRQLVRCTRSSVVVAVVVNLLLIWSPIELKSLKRVIAHARGTIDHVVWDVPSKLCPSTFIVGHPRRQVADGRTDRGPP